MKLYYLYVRDRRYTFEQMSTDGHIDLLDYMVKHGIVDQAVAIIDNYVLCCEEQVRPSGLIMQRRNGIDRLIPRPGDVVWVRGGWKSWLPWIVRQQKQRRWLLYYDANTGHRSWPYWDIVINDLSSEFAIGRDGRLNVPYAKPVSSVFRPEKAPMQFDCCIGASHIFDRKGQHYGFRAVLKYEELYGRKLSCIMPGGYYQTEARTQLMRQELPQHSNILVPGHIPREDLAKVFNRTRLLLATSGGGYGDRGPVEAASCGVPVIFRATKRVAPYMRSNPTLAHILRNAEDPVEFAHAIHTNLETAESRREAIATYMQETVSVEKSSGPLMAELFAFLRKNPKADRRLLAEASFKE